MNPDTIDVLYQYTHPYTGRCESCGEAETTLFFETPSGDQLCNDCARVVFDSFRERGLGIEVLEELDNEPDRTATSEESSESELQDVLTEVTPSQGRKGRPRRRVEFEYDGIDWEAVDESDLVGDSVILVWGGGPGAYEEVPASDVTAVQAYFDSTLSESNDVFLTADGAYVYDFVAEDIAQERLAAEIFRVLCDRSREGVVEGLQPVPDVGPPRDHLHTHLELHDDIERFEIRGCDGEMTCRVVPNEPRNRDVLAAEIRTIDGIQYSQPATVEIVDDLEHYASGDEE